MNAFGISNVGKGPGIEKRALLAHGFPLQSRRPKIGERIVAGIIVESVAPYEPGNIQDRVRADGVRPRRREVEGLDLGALVGRPQRRAAHRIHDQRATEVMGLLIVGIGILKPRARVAKIQMKRVRG